ncbi:enoyl-CoA hydratase/isomerase family protein [Ramlibacter sp. AN1133]|uniref:enoyl-CoA hydratase/isomerase family protein n=1 Tax=Ramlibacter sp. AN1133 TaxID=3133429 RepID=UPI0030C000FB
MNTFPDYATLQVVPNGAHVLLVTINRPEVMNAINTQMGHDLLDLWRRIDAEPGDTRCVVLTGAGERAFCAGGDLKERNGMTVEAWRAQHELFERAFMAQMECQIPIVAAVNGVAYGGGCETVAACDFVYAAAQARFALTEVKLGIMPGGGGTQNLARAVGERRAKELILTARPFSAQEAHEWGLVNRVCADAADLMAQVFATAEEIAANAPLSVRQAKRSIHYGLQTDLLTGYRFEIEAYNRLITTEDRLEGVRAFNEKRAPQWKGR